MPDDGRSRAPYIIICAGRIDLQAVCDPLGRIKAASDTARNLVTYYGERLTSLDTEPISELQHEMMDLVNGKALAGTRQSNLRSADEMVDEMFALLDQLEDRMERG